jgi:type II secretory pathway pseudopilin PulG
VVQGTPRTTVQERPRHSEAGDTLIEVLLSLVVLGLTSVALLIAFSTSIAASAEHRKLATYDTVLATASQEAIAEIQSQLTLFQNACTTPITSYPGYGASGFSLPAPYAGVYTVQYASVSPVQYWNGTVFQPTTCYNNEPQLITIGITGTSYTNSFVVDYPVGTSDNITGSGGAQRLVILNTLVGNYAGSPFTTQPIVEIETNAPNSPVTTDLSPVTLTITSGSGTLSGCTGNEILGVVTFSGCTIDPGGSYQITAHDGNLTSLPSNTFTVNSSAYHLVFTTQPVAGTSGSVFTYGPAVSVENAQNIVNTSWNGTITLTLSGGALSNCPGSTATIVNLVVTNGVATMPAACDFAGGYYYNAARNPPTTATQYTMRATANPTASSDAAVPAQSQSFSVTSFGAAAQLAFTVQPTGVASSTPSSVFSGQPAVAVEDAFGNVVTSSAVAVSLTVNSGGLGETLSGCTSTPSNGVYSFSGCYGNSWNAGLTLTASSPGLTSATSNPFNITNVAYSLSFKTSPTAGASGTIFAVQPVLVVKDVSNLVVTSTTAVISFVTSPLSGTLSTCTGLAPNLGYFNLANCTFAGVVGTPYTLTATSGTLTSLPSGSFSPTGPGVASKLVFTTQPAAGASGAALTAQPVVKVEDSAGNVVTSSTASITLTSSGGTLSSCTGLTAAAGVVNVSNCTFAGVVGTPYTLTATSGTLTSLPSSSILPTGPGVPSQVVLSGCSSDIVSLTTCTAAATIKDVYANVETADNSSSITFSQLSGSGTVTGLSGVTASAGTASVIITGRNIGPVVIGATADSINSNSVAFTINPLPQTITWTAPGAQTWVAGGAGTFSLGTASDTSGSVVTFASSTTGVCTVNGTTVTKVTAGTCAITPTAPAQGNYAVTTGATSYITINKIAQSVAFYTNNGYGTTTASGSATFNANNTTYQTYAQGSALGTISFASTSTGVCTVNAGTGLITFVTGGICTVTADAATTTNYLDSGTTTFTLTISKGSQSVAFYTSSTYTTTTTSNSAAYLPSGTYQTYAQGSAQGTISFASTSTGVCTVNAGTGLISFVTSGTCTVTADAATTPSYLDSGTTTFTLAVTPSPQFVSSSTAGGGSPSGPNLTLPVPTGISAGDLLIAVLYTGDPDYAPGDPTTVVLPTGWTLVSNATSPAAEPLGAILTASHVATASEPASYTFNSGNFNNVTAVMLAYVNSDGTTPLIDHSSWNTTMTSDTLTPSTAADTLVTVYGDYNGYSLSVPSPSVSRVFVGDPPYASTLAADQYLTSAAPVPGITASGNSGQGTSVTILLAY